MLQVSLETAEAMTHMPCYRVNHHHRHHHHYGQSITEKANERSVLLPNLNTDVVDDKVSKTIKTVRNVIVTIVGTSIVLYIIFAIHTNVYEWLKHKFQRISYDHAAFEPAFGQDRDEYGKRARSVMVHPGGGRQSTYFLLFFTR
jgi:hypothetical protein